MTLYFERHDGHAVTCDDFAQAIADANPGSELATRLPQFKRWYAQAGTPRVTARGRYDAPSRTYTLGLEQAAAASAGAGPKEPLVIPLAIGLVGRDGQAMPMRLEDEPASAVATERVLVLDETRAFFTFVDVDAAAGALAAARFLRAGGAGRRPRRRRPAGPAAPRQRPVQPLGSRPAPGPQPPGRGRPERRAAVLDADSSPRWASCCATRSSTPRSRTWR